MEYKWISFEEARGRYFPSQWDWLDVLRHYGIERTNSKLYLINI